MVFRYRPARPQDLTGCVAQARDAFAYDSSDYADILAMWTDLITAGSTVSMVIEETETGSIAFFAIMVFVTAEFAARLAAAAVPPLTSGYWLEAWRAGILPVLTQEQVRAANSTNGVSLFCIASGVSLDTIAQGQYALLMGKVNECHPFSFAGYRMNAIYVELYDDMTCAWGDTFGYNRITDFADWYALQGGVPSCYGDQRPHLYGITKEQALRKYGSMVMSFFHYTPPRFDFTPPEQEMLLWALSGDKDEYLSTSLYVAPVTIRKRWDSIYGRVANVQPNFFGGEVPLRHREGRRGAEKKRQLLSYLEHHMEELRPHRFPVSR